MEIEGGKLTFGGFQMQYCRQVGQADPTYWWCAPAGTPPPDSWPPPYLYWRPMWFGYKILMSGVLERASLN